MTKRINITEYGAVSGGEVLCTDAIQTAIDKAAELECEVYIPQGTYLTGALFLKSNMSLHLAKDAVLVGSAEDIWVVNVLQASHVRIHGAGTIGGQGQSTYFPKGNVIVRDCNDVRLENFACVGSGCESIHISYSTNVAVKGLKISDTAECSAGGIVVDSCTAVLVEQCQISCKGDSVCIMNGEAAHAVQENAGCENIMVRDCVFSDGPAITLTNENAGSMRNISVCDNIFKRTLFGFRIKTAGKKGGVIEDVEVTNLKMEDVSCCFCLTCNREAVPEEKGLSPARNIRISQVITAISKGNSKPVKAFSIEGLPEAPFADFVFEDMELQVREYGTITNVKNLRFVNVTVNVVA